MSISRRQLAVDGFTREFLLAEPSGTASAVILSLHGTRSSADGQLRLSQMAALAGSAGAVVVFPQAIVPAGPGYEWDEEGDMPYLARLVDELRSSYPLPEARVCMTGMSGGARMSCHFAWLRADAVRMAGAVAGLRAVTAEPPTRPVPVLAFHGTADRINPYGGSGTARWDESVPDAARRWGVGNGVASEPEEVAVTRTLTRTTYGHEGDPGEVTLWTSRGAGHTWPGGRLGLVLRLLLGRTSQEIDATAQISSFAQVERGQPGRG